MTFDDMSDDLRRRLEQADLSILAPFDCPIDWCIGGGSAHREGGPDTWLHQSAYEPFAGVRGGGNFIREGGGALRYSFELYVEGDHDAGALDMRAEAFRSLADTFEARAASLRAGKVS